MDASVLRSLGQFKRVLRPRLRRSRLTHFSTKARQRRQFKDETGTVYIAVRPKLVNAQRSTRSRLLTVQSTWQSENNQNAYQGLVF